MSPIVKPQYWATLGLFGFVLFLSTVSGVLPSATQFQSVICGMLALLSWAVTAIVSEARAEPHDVRTGAAESTVQPRGKPAPSTAQQKSEPDPIQVLKLRFAKGEITKEQYEEMLRLLREP